MNFTQRSHYQQIIFIQSLLLYHQILRIHIDYYKILYQTRRVFNLCVSQYLMYIVKNF